MPVDHVPGDGPLDELHDDDLPTYARDKRTLVQLEFEHAPDGSYALIKRFNIETNETDVLVRVNNFVDDGQSCTTLVRMAHAMFPADRFHLQLWDEDGCEWIDSEP